ncbi:MAG TPA: PRC-barrel domain-containing protein [Solirubrobacterales bacterium]
MELRDPGALSELLGRKVVDQSGRRLGRVYEAKAHWEGDAVVIDELLLGRTGIRRRLRGPGGPEKQAVPWESVVDLRDETVVVRR